MGTKKDVEQSFSPSPIPIFRPSHCLYLKISIRRPAHVERHILTHYIHATLYVYIPRYTPPMGSYTLLIYIRNEDVGEYKIHPRERFVASPLNTDSNLRDLIEQTGNVLKTSFRDWPYNWPEVSSIDVKYYVIPTLGQTFRCKFTYIFLITKYFLGKIRFLTKKS